MKINKIFLVSIFILAIITFGAVSATDNLTADNYDSLSTADEIDFQTAADDAAVGGDEDEKEEIYLESIDGEKFITGDEVDIPVYCYGEVELTANDFTFQIDGMDYNFTYDSICNEVRFNTTGLSLDSHNYLLKFIENDFYYSDEPSSGSFDIVEYDLDIPDSVICGYSGPEYIIFTTPASMAGSILSVSIGDVTLSKKVTLDPDGINGFASFDLFEFSLSYGDHEVIAKLDGEIIENKTIFVDYEIYVGDSYMTYGEKQFVLSEMRGIVASDIEVKINGSSYPIYIDKTLRSMPLYVTGVNDLKPGVYDVELRYIGDKFPEMAFNGTFEIEAAIVSPDRVVGNPETDVFRLVLPEDAKGNLTIYIKRSSETEFRKYVTVSVGGETIIPIENLSYGEYEYYVEYSADDYSISGDTYFTVNPNITLPTEQIMIGENATISIDLPDEEGTLSVGFADEAEYISEVDLVDGKATIQIPNLKEGVSRLAVSLLLDKYDKYGDYYSELYSWRLDASVKPNLTLPSGKVMLGDKLFVTVSLPGYNGTLVVREDVKEGEGYAADLVNGNATVLIPKLDRIGKLNYYAYLTLGSDGAYGEYYEDSYTYMGTLEVVNPITAADTSILYSANGNYKAQIKDLDGKAITSGKVTFYILDGAKQILKKDVNIVNGVATLSYAIKQGVKTYQIKTVYKTASVTKKLTVKHVLSLKVGAVKKSAKKLVLTGKLAKVNGKYLKGKTIIFKFNGKTYKAKTNKKGIAKVTVKSTTLKKLKVGKKITVQATYIKDTVKKTIKVRK